MIVHGPFFCCFLGFERSFWFSVVGPSAFGWGLITRRSFRVSLPCFGCVYFGV